MFVYMFFLDLNALNDYPEGGPIMIGWDIWFLPNALSIGITLLPLLGVIFVIVVDLTLFKLSDEEQARLNIVEPVQSQHINPHRFDARLAVAVWNFIVPPVPISLTLITLLLSLAYDQHPWSHRSKTLAYMLPERSSSLQDLDQTVAASAGAYVLFFNFCSATSAWYKHRSEQRSSQRDCEPDETTPSRPVATARAGSITQSERPNLPHTDYELRPIEPSHSTRDQIQERRREPSTSDAMQSEVDAQKGADLRPAIAPSGSRGPRAHLHVRWADQDEARVYEQMRLDH